METISFLQKNRSDLICNHVTYANSNTWKSTALILSSLCPHLSPPLHFPRKTTPYQNENKYTSWACHWLSASVYWNITSDEKDIQARYTKNTSGHPLKPNSSSYENKIFLEKKSFLTMFVNRDSLETNTIKTTLYQLSRKDAQKLW